MTKSLEVVGLQQAIANLNDLDGKAKLDIGRAALLEEGLEIVYAVKAATYITFKRQTGAIQSGFGVRVGHKLVGTTLNSFIVEYPQNALGSPNLMQALRQHVRRNSRSRKAVSLQPIAFWWLFLERGTKPRRRARTPASLTQHPGATRLNRSITRWQNAASTGQITSRRWIAPALDSSAQRGIKVFIETMHNGVEAAVNAMPK